MHPNSKRFPKALHFFIFGYHNFFQVTKQLEERNIIDSFKHSNEREISALYARFRPKFLNWLKGSYGIGEESAAKEIYQRSFTVLYVNAKRGKLDNIGSTIETYLYGIAKNVMREQNREEKSSAQLSSINETEVEQLDLFQDLLNGDLDDNLVQKMQGALVKLGDPCKEILKLFYWERNSMEAIATKVGYKNEKVAKKKKYTCLQKLKELMQE